jgi:polysaccharide deacetylase family protein (PEP-CTERM system associated)
LEGDSAGMLPNAFTIDVEDAVNQAMRNLFNKPLEPTVRVYENTGRLLDLFSEFETKATFFILGEVARTYPALIREIANRGHELGIHGYSHTRYDLLTREKIKEEILTAKNLVEDISGVEVLGHRAPEFSINQDNIWVLEILLEAGIKYDSSIFPAKLKRYGWQGFNKSIDWITLENGSRIIEAPLSTINYIGKEVPVCGGGYLRAYPFIYTDNAFRIIQKKRPVNVYLHPYEIDVPPFQEFYMEEVRHSSRRTRWKLYAYWYNRKSVVPKLRRLLKRYQFDTLYNVIQATVERKH